MVSLEVHSMSTKNEEMLCGGSQKLKPQNAAYRRFANKIISNKNLGNIYISRKGSGNKSVSRLESAGLSALCFAKSALPTASIFAVH